jgi:UDP-N-acetylglucosamine 1-carboxyvinyltransferase
MTLLANNTVKIGNMPAVVDIKTLLKLIENLGGTFSFSDKNTVEINTCCLTNTTATYDIVKTMRASILVLGPLLSQSP